MPIRQGRKVTELTALNSASLNTYVVGVDNNITYKISLDVLEDAVVKIVSSSTDARLDSIESYTASIDVSSLNSSLAITDGRLNSLEQTTASFFTEENSNPSENNFVAVFGENNKIQKGAIFVTGSRVIIGGPSASVHPFVPEALAVYSQLDGYNLISGHGITNNYLQLNIKNFSNLTNASSDVVATANNGDEESFYVNMGINGSGYDEDTIIGTANDAYIYGYGNTFHIGNAAEYPVYIFAGGFDSKGEHLKLIIDPNNNHVLTGSLDMSGSLEIFGNQYISGAIEFYNTSNPSNITTIVQQDSDGTLSVSNGRFVPSDGIRIPGGQVQMILKNDSNSDYDAYIENINNVGLRISSSTATDAILELSGYSLNVSNDINVTGSVYADNLIGLISSSAQITEFGFLSSSQTINTGSFATTGSNIFIGTQTITGSLNISGSANLKVNQLLVGTSSGLEGGEIDLVYAQTTSLTGSSVAFDVYGDKIRIFEGGGNSRGVSVDLSKAPAGAGGELLWKVSEFVNAGTFVTLDNVKVTVTTGGNRGLSIGAVSTSFVANIGATYGLAVPGTGGASANNVTYTTTASASAFGWSFGSAGDISTYILNDTTNSRVYRITLMIGTSYNANFISIERLH